MKVYSGTYSNKNEPYFNEEYDALWQEANFGLEAKLDNAYRLELTRKMEEITIEDAVTIPIYEMPAYTMIADRIQLPVKEYVPVFGLAIHWHLLLNRTENIPDHCDIIRTEEGAQAPFSVNRPDDRR